MKTMAMAVVGRVVVNVHSTEPPAEEEWNAFVTMLGARVREDRNVRNLVITAGGAPNSAQRSKVNAFVEVQPRLCSVIADSPLVRGAVIALNWFNPSIKVFSPGQTDQAFKHLDLSPHEVKEVLATVARLKAELHASNAKAVAR
jgi:hypothetical protein